MVFSGNVEVDGSVVFEMSQMFCAPSDSRDLIRLLRRR